MKGLIKFMIIIIIVSFSNQLSYSQNLVKNGSFEESKYSSGLSAKKWYYSPYNYGKSRHSAFAINTDYYKENIKKFKKQKMLGGFQQAHSGKCYGILFLSMRQELSYSIKTKLKKKLKKDNCYSVSFYANLSDTSIYALSDIGIHFSEKDIVPHYIEKIILKSGNWKFVNDNRFNIVSPDFICDTTNWTKVSGIYKAKGGEKYLNLGLMVSDSLFREQRSDFLINDMNIYKIEPDFKVVYYIDDVSVIKIGKNANASIKTINEPTCNYDKTRIIKIGIGIGEVKYGRRSIKSDANDTIKLNKEDIIFPDTLNRMNIGDEIKITNIFFDKYDNITKPSMSQIHLFQRFLQDNKSFEIEIVGHSNIKETEELNVRRSAQLALKVLYSINHTNDRVDIKRLSFKGYGSRKIGNSKDVYGKISIKLIKKEVQEK